MDRDETVRISRLVANNSITTGDISYGIDAILYRTGQALL